MPGAPTTDSQDPVLEPLTKREREVLAMIGRGLSLPEIAETLFRSLKTIETHRLSLGRKLNASNRVELARIAIRAGLAPLEPEQEAWPAEEPADTCSGKTQVLDILRSIQDRTAHLTGGAYFRQLLRQLTRSLGVRSALLAKYREQGNLALIACCEADKIVDAPVIGEVLSLRRPEVQPDYFHIERDARQRLGPCPLLDRFECEAMAGLWLHGESEKRVGVLCVCHDQSLENRSRLEDVLQLVAHRAAAELERLRTDERLRSLRESLEDLVEQRTADLRRLNRELTEREQRYRTLVETMSDGLIIVDTQGIITYANPRLSQLLGTPASDLLGRHATQIMTDDSARFWSSMQRDREHGRLEPYRLDMLGHDGRQVSLHVAPRTLFDSEGAYTGSFAVLTPLEDVEQTVRP